MLSKIRNKLKKAKKILQNVTRVMKLLPQFFTSQNYTYDLSMFTLFQNDAEWLPEWIEFHQLQGVKHFYLYNNLSTDNYHETLKKYIESGSVTLIDWNFNYLEGQSQEWSRIQTKAYMHCINNFGNQSKWIAFIDNDEFLFCTDGQDLPSFLKNYEKYSGLCVNWQMYGSSDIEEIPKGKLMIEMLVRCAKKDHGLHHSVKSIVRPRFVLDCQDPHFFNFVMGHAVTENKILCELGKSHKISAEQIRLNHYWTRTKKHMRESKIPRCNKLYKDPEMPLYLDQEFNLDCNESILQFIPALKSRLFCKE